MVLEQSALIDLLEALKNTNVDERVRTATEHLYQALIDAELTAVIVPARTSGRLTGRRSATAPGRGR